MQKRIFSLWGIAGTGKTTTIKFIAREIMRQFFSARADLDLEPLPAGDITTIITIDGIKIGITSKGDSGTSL